MNRRNMAIVVIALVLGAFAPRAAIADESRAAVSRKKPVHLIIDYGDGVEKHFTAITWKSGMTVFDALRAAAAVKHGIALKYRGKGATLFVERIDDLKNEGNGRNWIFRVNGRLADRSSGIQPIKPGDTVLWRFGKYR